jgi:hypothetical protein
MERVEQAFEASSPLQVAKDYVAEDESVEQAFRPFHLGTLQRARGWSRPSVCA